MRVAVGTERVAVGEDIFAPMIDALLDNAVTHASAGAHVDITARAAREHVVITVSDDGPGISEANAARIFQPFFTTARARGGTGLGLAIAGALASNAGGAIRLVPSPVGAAFEVELPTG